MEINGKLALVCVIGSAAIGAGLMRHYGKLETVVTKEVVKNNIVTVVKEVKAPDGTTTTETTTTDQTVHNEQSSAPAPVSSLRPTWIVQAGYDMNRQFNAQVSKQLLGSVYVGASARQDGVLGLVVGVTF